MSKSLLALFVFLAIIAGTTTTQTTNIAFSEKGGNSDEHSNNDNNDESDDATTTTTTTTDEEEDDQQAVESGDDSETLQATANEREDNPNGNDDNVPGDNPQPDRVGSHDQQTSPEGSAGGGTVTDPTLCDITDNPDCSTTVDTNCFGKVISERAQDHKENPEEGTLGSHSRDPVPELPGNETPRQGIGNQNQGHPAAHGAFNSQFEEEDEQNVIDNC